MAELARTDLDLLRQEHPELAADLAKVRAELDRPTTTTNTTDDPAATVNARVAQARTWDRLVDQVRALPGFADFARPAPAALLRRAATGGTVVMVNISRWRCDALLITTAGITLRPGPAKRGRGSGGARPAR